MTLTTQPRTGRQLMVLDDAETIAVQARRRAALRKRRQEAAQIALVVLVVGSVMALMIGVDAQTLLLADIALFVGVAAGWRWLQERMEQQRRHRSWAQPGRGIGTPRPKGAFSTTRHRSGAPVWVDDRAA